MGSGMYKFQTMTFDTQVHSLTHPIGSMPIYEAPCLNVNGTYQEDFSFNDHEMLVMICNLFFLVPL